MKCVFYIWILKKLIVRLGNKYICNLIYVLLICYFFKIIFVFFIVKFFFFAISVIKCRDNIKIKIYLGVRF